MVASRPRVAPSAVGWVLLASGVTGLVGAFGVWADAGAAVSYGATFDGPAVAVASLGAVVVGVLAVAGLARWWVCAIAVGCALVTVGAAAHGYVEVGNLQGFRAAVHDGWGLLTTTVASVVQFVSAGVGVLVRRGRAPGWAAPVPKLRAVTPSTASVVRGTSPSDEAVPTFPQGAPPDVTTTATTFGTGRIVTIAALVGFLVVFAPWQQDPLSDASVSGAVGLGGGVVIVAALVAAGCGAALVVGRGGVAAPIVILCTAPWALLVTFLTYGQAEKLFIPVTIPGGKFTQAGWGVYCYAAALLVVLVGAVRVLGFRSPPAAVT